MILGLPKTTAYIALGVVAFALLAIVAFFALRGKGGAKKHNKKKHHDDTSSGSSDDKGGGTSTGTESDDSSDDGKKSKYKALAKLDLMAEDEQRALRDGLYRDAAKNPTGLSGLGKERLRAFSMGKQDSSDGYSSDGSLSSGEEYDKGDSTRSSLARKSLKGL